MTLVILLILAISFFHGVPLVFLLLINQNPRVIPHNQTNAINCFQLGMYDYLQDVYLCLFLRMMEGLIDQRPYQLKSLPSSLIPSGHFLLPDMNRTFIFQAHLPVSSVNNLVSRVL